MRLPTTLLLASVATLATAARESIYNIPTTSTDPIILTPGQHLIAKLPCLGCPFYRRGDTFRNPNGRPDYLDWSTPNYLIFNLSVAPAPAKSDHDFNVLMNNVPIYPELSYPELWYEGYYERWSPPRIYGWQLAVDTSSADLDWITRVNLMAPGNRLGFDYGTFELAYDITEPVQSQRSYVATAHDEKVLTVRFDVLGLEVMPWIEEGKEVVMDVPGQKMLELTVVESLTGSVRVHDVKLVDRAAPEKQPAEGNMQPGKCGSLFGKFMEKWNNWFGQDPAYAKPGHFIYHPYQYDGFGRKGSFLRTWHIVQNFLLDNWIIIVPTIAGIIAVSPFFLLIFWGGRRLYRERQKKKEEEEVGLLAEAPEEGRTSDEFGKWHSAEPEETLKFLDDKAEEVYPQL